MTIDKKPETKAPHNTTDPAAVSSTVTKMKTPDNKSIFGPLGRYAVIGVIMVSVIVTTAIMLDEQVNTIDTQLAEIQEQVANSQITTAEAVAVEVTPVVDDETVLAISESSTTQAANDTTSTSIEVEVMASPESDITADIATVDDSNTEVTASAEPAAVEPVSVEPVATTEPAVTEAAATKSAPVEQVATLVESTEVAAQSDQKSLDLDMEQSFQARIEAYKREQKQRMIENFARIKELETEQLEEYKASQEVRIERLRNQVAERKMVIDELIQREQESLEMRKANMEKHRIYREQMLNRI